MDLHAKSVNSRNEETGLYMLLFVLNTVYVCVPEKKDGQEISDYRWMAPNDSMSCWEKAHSFYIPRGLFKAGVCLLNQEWTTTKKLKFVNAAMSNECYSGKRRAFGLGAMKRGGNSQCKTPKSKGTPGDLLLLDNDSDSDEWAHGVLEAVSVGSIKSGNEE
jgi:hypothetical protein